MSSESVTSILGRLIDATQGNLSQGVAEAVLQIDFSSLDHARMEELAEKSNRGELSAEESEAYGNYIGAADLLALWQSKARMSLRRQAAQV